jgi:hypothetical protein
MSARTQPARRAPLRLLAVVVAVVVAAAVSATLVTNAFAGDFAFTDVPSDHPFVEEIDFVADARIAEGFPDGTYRPGQPVSRQAMAAFLARAQSYVVVAELATASNTSTLSANVRCGRSRHVAISGGAVYQGAGRAFLSSSGPGSGGGWAVGMTTDDGVVRTMTMTAFAVCVPESRVQPESGG